MSINTINQVCDSLNSIILDKSNEIELCVLTILAQGHLLIEDTPGVGKTTLIQALSKLMGVDFARVQGTSDLLPSDIIGTSILNQKLGQFEFVKGPLFHNIVMIDELNRMSPRSQSALLQAMEEAEVSIDGKTQKLPEPFFVFATQNPQAQSGTFPLPESQLDRFLTAIELKPPNLMSERKLIQGFNPKTEIQKLKPLLSSSQLLELIALCEKVHMSPKASEYISNILVASRMGPGPALSTRAGMAIAKMAKAKAFLSSAPGVLIEHIQFVAPFVIGHRLGGELGLRSGLVKANELLNQVKVPI